jgi:sulfur carrier protein
MRRYQSLTTGTGYLICIESSAYDVGSMNTMTLEINGETRAIPTVSNVVQLLEVLGISGSHVAVEINRKVIRRGDWEHTPISDQDRVEIVQFVGGG